MLRTVTIVAVLLLAAPVASAQKPLSSVGSANVESFDGFQGLGFQPDPPAGWLDSDEFSVTGFDETATGTNGDCLFGETCPDLSAGQPAGTDFSRGVSAGDDQLSAGIYAFDHGSGDMSIGWQAKSNNFEPGDLNVKYRNNTGVAVNQIALAFEIWYLNSDDGSHKIAFSWATGACTGTGDSFTTIPSFEFTTPEGLTPDPEWAMLDRSATVNLPGSLAHGDCFFMRFTGDKASGGANQDETSVDDLSVTPVVALPVELVSFSGVQVGQDVLLHWAAGQADAFAGFDVEHRSEGQWTSEAFVPSRGEHTEYRYTVSSLKAGTHTFRLRMVDVDGSYRYSPVVEVAVGTAGAVQVDAPYPNPTSGPARFGVSVLVPQVVEAAVFDLLGRRVATLFRGPLQANEYRELSIATEGLPAGTYLVRAAGADFSQTHRLTVSR